MRAIKIISFIVMLIVIVAILFQYFLFGIMNIYGRSMKPSLRNGQNVLISRLNKTPKYQSIVLFKSVKNPDITNIGRVIALPKDKVTIKSNKVYLNGQRLIENYTKGKTILYPDSFVKENTEYVVPDESLFVLGDNRENSGDSREYGFVPIKNLVGVVIKIF